MGFLDGFNHAGVDVIKVMLEQLPIAYLALHRVMPVLPTVKAAQTSYLNYIYLKKKNITYVCERILVLGIWESLSAFAAVRCVNWPLPKLTTTLASHRFGIWILDFDNMVAVWCRAPL